MTLRIAAAAWRHIAADAAARYPAEACGILVGRDGVPRHAERAVPCANLAARPDRFEIAPEEFLACERAARAEGLEVLGFYHSHPGHAPSPSAFDLERAWPYYSYVIVRVDRGRLGEARSFRLAPGGGGFVPEELERGGGSP